MNSDSSVFMVSYVPLNISSSKDILWKNPRPSSIRYCRPLKFEFCKETALKTQEEYEFYSDEISKLKLTVIRNNKTYHITHKLYCTMIDGKICNTLTDQKSSASCNICTIKQLQNK